MGKSGELVSFFEDMLSRQEYLIPLVAASFQYPIHYYGMTSAALLEDLFVDASINFRNSYRRDIEISRPGRDVAGEDANSKGVKGWDYQFEGEHFSHKVGKGINAIALLWDATVKLPEDNIWSYDSTMVYVLSNFKKSKANLISPNIKKTPITSIVHFRNTPVKGGQILFIAKRINRTEWEILEVIELKAGTDIAHSMPREDIWGKMIMYWSKATANVFDIFISCTPGTIDYSQLVGSAVEIDYETHPGVYVFERERLQNIQVTQNNRAVLLPAPVVTELATDAAQRGLFVFMPSWFKAYAENRPADLYLAQKKEFDDMNSASRKK